MWSATDRGGRAGGGSSIDTDGNADVDGDTDSGAVCPVRCATYIKYASKIDDDAFLTIRGAFYVSHWQDSTAKRRQKERERYSDPSIHPSISCHSNLSCLVLLQFVAQFDFDGLLCFISLLTDSIVSGFYVSLSMRTPTTHTHAHTNTRIHTLCT